jgi:Plasmid pRiA4b ORF-3-like protein
VVIELGRKAGAEQVQLDINRMQRHYELLGKLMHKARRDAAVPAGGRIAGVDRMTKIARLRVAIDEVAPAVVRRVEVPLAMRLDDLHFVLQIAIGWQNCHPFEFRVGDKAWGLVDRDADSNPLPAESATLADVHALGRPFKYGYVFGEDW